MQSLCLLVFCRLLIEIQTLAKNWEEWTNQSMAGLPETLARSRLTIAQRFAQTLKRQAAFLHLTQVLADAHK